MRQKDWIAYVNSYSKLIRPSCSNCMLGDQELLICIGIREDRKIDPLISSCGAWKFDVKYLPKQGKKKMNTSSANGLTVSCGNGKVIINGEEIPIPNGMKLGSQAIIDGKVFIGGYEFFPEEKIFRKTLKALKYFYG